MQKYSLSWLAQRMGFAIIAYIFEDYRTPNAQFCAKTYVTACIMGRFGDALGYPAHGSLKVSPAE